MVFLNLLGVQLGLFFLALYTKGAGAQNKLRKIGRSER